MDVGDQVTENEQLYVQQKSHRVYGYVSLCLFCVCRYCHRPEASVRSPAAGVTGSYEPLNVAAEYQALVLWKRNKCS